jgi:hypothetical protein
VRYNPDTESNVLTLEALSHSCLAAIAARPVPRHDVLAQVWDPSSLGYVNQVINIPVGCPYRPAVAPF